ncbi:ATP-grasp domain-containing protein [Pararhizobium mangrovi]|uniref:ATP-grasp domain-containing protein n=1 Tax=Pararhizobium mangrovi TaxID=2590452 RepID=UPI001AEEFDF1|nr:ATP-grasp domain-containing protein [Pararhizobium mangrovi]
MTKNIFVIGLNDYNLEKLKRLRGADDIAFHGLIDPAALYDTEVFDVPAMLAEAEEKLSAFDGSIDAIVGYMDFPVSTMLPILGEKFGVRHTSLEALLKCEHKYWSRVLQHEVIPENVPAFAAFDPFDEGALSKIGEAGLTFPFFVKPIKSSGSRLGFRIDSPEDFDYATRRLREDIGTISEPFNFLLDQANLPADIRAIDGQYCLAEQVIGGRQCTLEGYVKDGKVVPYAIVDSVRYPQVLSFFYYMYPSKLPDKVQAKMRELAVKVMEHVGFDQSGFNIEFFWDEVQDQIWLLEVNTRIAQAHCDLFEKVDGVSHQQIMVDVALGNEPDMPWGEGKYKVAGHFFYRVFFIDATITQVPSEEETADALRKVPDTIIRPQVHVGMRLSDLPEQDSYSYALCYVLIGASKQSTLLWNYEQVMKSLTFEFSDLAD